MTEYVGIDVGKYYLDIAISGKSYQIANEALEIKAWLSEQKVISSSVVVFEPTGGYERCLKRTLEELAIGYAMPHANHIRAYAKACGQLAKTDRIDAELIRSYGEHFKLTARARVEKHGNLKGILLRREQLVEQRRREKNRLETAEGLVLASIKEHIAWLSSQIKSLEKALLSSIELDEALRTDLSRLETIPGIGLLTGIRLLVDLPELSQTSGKELAALAGVAPYNRDSGYCRGKRYTMGGRRKVRSALYMAALTGIRCNGELKRFYERLKSRGKPSKVALTAAMRKLLTMVRSVLQGQRCWQDTYPVNIPN